MLETDILICTTKEEQTRLHDFVTDYCHGEEMGLVIILGLALRPITTSGKRSLVKSKKYLLATFSPKT